MKKRTIAIIASIVLVFAVTIPSALIYSYPHPPITGAAIGQGWALTKTAELNDGTRWTYQRDNQTLTFRERTFETEQEANILYLKTFASDKVKMAEPITFKQNAFVGIYYDNWQLKGPWLILVAQDGRDYYEIAYTDDEDSYGGQFETDADRLKELAADAF